MENQLIPLINDPNGNKAVNARDLHAFLENKKQFADWIQHRIKKYGLVEGTDFVTISPNGEAGAGAALAGFNKKEYALTMDAAKELSMVEGNAKGKVARKYFIECEKQLKQVTTANLDMIAQTQYAQAKISEVMLTLVKDLHDWRPSIESRVAALEQAQPQAPNAIVVPEIGLRDHCNMEVRKLAEASGIEHADVWKNVYEQLMYRFHISIRAYKKENPNESLLSVAERNGLLDKVYAIIFELARNYYYDGNAPNFVFAKCLRTFMNQTGYRIKDLAKLTGINHTHIGRQLSGKCTPFLSSIAKYARALPDLVRMFPKDLRDRLRIYE